MSQPIIVVFGATGKQGGSVLRTLLADPATASKYKLRAVTRDVAKPAAKSLTEQGVEVIAADMDEKGSIEKAVQGAYGVFAVTDYWAKMDGPLEIKQGKTIADAALVSWASRMPFTRLYLGSRRKALRLFLVEEP